MRKLIKILSIILITVLCFSGCEDEAVSNESVNTEVSSVSSETSETEVRKPEKNSQNTISSAESKTESSVQSTEISPERSETAGKISPERSETAGEISQSESSIQENSETESEAEFSEEERLFFNSYAKYPESVKFFLKNVVNQLNFWIKNGIV